MSIQAKTIGRMPTDHGPYDPQLAYGKKFQCTLFGCAWESLRDNNNTVPAVWDGGDTITPNLVDWKKVSGSYEAWLMNKDKPATTGTTGAYPYNGMGRVVLKKNIVEGVNTLTHEAFEDSEGNDKENTIYVIQYDFTLGEDITVPANCVLEFDGGSINNGKILGNFCINAGSFKIFDNVEIPEYVGIFKFRWFVGTRTVIVNSDFTKLPNTIIDFEDVEYTTSGNIALQNVTNCTFKNFKATISTKMTMFFETMPEPYFGTCAPVSTSSSYNKSIITTSVQLPQEYVGSIIRIKTADATKWDNRPDGETNIPTLFKGITSVITEINGNNVTIADYIEPFSASAVYEGVTLFSEFRVYKPKTLNLINCNFVCVCPLSELPEDNRISLDSYNSIIRDCSFKATVGAPAILALNGYNNIVENCIVGGAMFDGTQTSYGIQTNSATNITIKNSSFYDNRRAVDFSGEFESRYCTVQDCTIHSKGTWKPAPDNYYVEDGLGGHSTSYANKFINNKFFGLFQSAINCRGENEIIEGNVFAGFCYGSVVSACINTIIQNNIVEDVYNTKSGVFVASLINVPSEVYIANNIVTIRQYFVNNSHSGNSFVLKNNKINFINSTNEYADTYIFNEETTFVYLGNTITRNTKTYTKINNGHKVDLRSCVIDNFIMPLVLYGISSPLSDNNPEKVTSEESYLMFDMKSTGINGRATFVGTIKVYINITLSAEISQDTTLKAPNDIVFCTSSVNKKGLSCNPANIYANTKGQSVVISVTNDKLYIGDGSYNGHLTAGEYFLETYL